MKSWAKCFVIVLLLASMVACGNKPKTVADKIAAGEDVYVGFSFETGEDPFFLAQLEYMRSTFEGAGIKLDYAASRGDDLVMSEQINSFVSSAVELIICAPPHEDAIARALIDAAAEGIPVVVMGRRPEYYGELAGGTYLDWYEAGREMAIMASAWVTENYPNAPVGSIHAANLISDSQNIFLIQNAGLIQGLAEDPRISITYNRNDTYTAESGAEAAESALIYDQDIRLFFCHQEPTALGVSKFVVSGTSGLDPAQYAAFSVGLQSAGRALIESSKINESIFRGAVTYGVFSESKQKSASESIYIVARDILLDKAPSESWWVELDRWAVTGFGYNYLYDSPANDELLKR